LKEVTEKLPVDIPETNILSTIHTRAEDFLKEISESETSELESKQQEAHDISATDSDSSKLENISLVKDADSVEVDSCLEKLVESLQENAHDISTSPSGTFELQDQRLEQNADILGDDRRQHEGNILDEINKPTLESKQQNSHDISTPQRGTFELQDHKLEQNADDILRDDRCQDEGNILDEINKPTLESKQQNSPDITTSDSDTSELQVQPTLESKQQNSPDITTSDSDTSKLQVLIHEKIDKTARVDQSEGGINVRQESNGSTISIVGEMLSPQNSGNGSISPLDSSRDERLQETQVFEKFESGVYVLVVLRDDGIKLFKRVKFR
jgi:hypothetical protein